MAWVTQEHLKLYIKGTYVGVTEEQFNLLEQELFFLILAHPVHKMWIIQEPNMLELWNKLHFEEEKTGSLHHV